MRRLAVEIEKLRELNRSTAAQACVYLDLVRRTGFTPADLLQMQTALRRDLLQVESRLIALRDRSAGRGRRLSARAKRGPEAGKAVGRHIQALQERDRALVLRRLLLRQIADSFVWHVFRLDARTILPLYREQTHWLPRREGLGGPVEMARRALKSGELFVFENDLTRCLGVGDLTAVFATRPWTHPLTYEVKSSWELGAQLKVEAIAIVTDDPTDLAMHECFKRVTGFPDLAIEVRSRERPEQTAEQLSAAQLLRAAKRMVGQRLYGPSAKTWKTLGTVLTRALADGACYDLAERGVVFMAMRSVDDRAPEAVSGHLFEAVRDLPGFGPESMTATSVDLRRYDEWSAVVLPLVLWPLSPEVRAALLCGELYLCCVVRPDTWRDAMKAEGLELTEEGRGWIVTASSATATHLDALEVGKLTLGVAFSGVSPREIAAGLAASLSGDAGRRGEALLGRSLPPSA